MDKRVRDIEGVKERVQEVTAQVFADFSKRTGVKSVAKLEEEGVT